MDRDLACIAAVFAVLILVLYVVSVLFLGTGAPVGIPASHILISLAACLTLILPWLITWVWSWRQAIGIAACYLGSAAVTVLMARFVYTHAAQVWAAVATAFPWWWIGVIYAIIEAVVFLLAATSFLLVDRRARREVSLV